MNISEFARANNVSTDTIRYYEKEGILNPPLRKDNGYRSYTPMHAETVRFVRMAQSLGFSLAEIRAVLPQLADGTLDRSEIERRLVFKITQIDTHIDHLRALKKDLQSALGSLDCMLTQFACTADEMPVLDPEKIAQATLNQFTPLTNTTRTRQRKKSHKDR